MELQTAAPVGKAYGKIPFSLVLKMHFLACFPCDFRQDASFFEIEYKSALCLLDNDSAGRQAFQQMAQAGCPVRDKSDCYREYNDFSMPVSISSESASSVPSVP